MPTRTARTSWTGGLQDGSGKVELTSSGLGSYEVSFPKRASDDGGGVTNPEELVAAAHSACFAMSLSAQIGRDGGTPLSLDVKADVTLGADPAGGFKISRVLLTVRGSVEGIDEAGFIAAAEKAKVGCIISKALAATTIELDAALA